MNWTIGTSLCLMNLKLNHSSSADWIGLHSAQSTALDIQKFSSLAVWPVDPINISSSEKYTDDGSGANAVDYMSSHVKLN